MNARTAIPIVKDHAYLRFTDALADGWEAKAFRLGQGKAFVITSKDFDVPQDHYDAAIGVDVGVKRLASVSVIAKSGRVLKQLYLGEDIGDNQRNISIRRSRLHYHRDGGSRCAKQALRRLRNKERNFVKTRSEQVAHEVLALAKEYNALIATEDLKNLIHARGNKKGNRKSKRLPYGRFRAALELLATQDARWVLPVNPRDTSRTCSRCDRRGVRNGALFRCPSCGYVGNADRNASVNIARRAAFQRPNLLGQISARNLQVMAGVLAHAGA